METLPAQLFLRPQISNIERFECDKSKLLSNYSAEIELINHDENIANCAEEMADILSVFGRTSKIGRRNDTSDNDSVTCVLEENAEEKVHVLIKQISSFTDHASILNYARQLFPNDGDLMQVLRKLLLSKNLSERQKKKVNEALKDLLRFGDQKKMQSSINVSVVAKRFSECGSKINVSPQALRECYLRFLEIALPASFHYKDWIDEFGFRNRKILLSFTLSALVTDMMASEPGVHFHEFGPISSRLSSARILHTLDQQLIASFQHLRVNKFFKNCRADMQEYDILTVYLTGLTEFDSFELTLKNFIHDAIPSSFYIQQAIVVQKLRKSFNLTPVVLFSNDACRDLVMDVFSVQLESLSKREKTRKLPEENYI